MSSPAVSSLPAARRSDAAVRFHMSLNVSDLAASVEFYRRVFGIEPAKVRSDYAKFEVLNPPLVLSLEPADSGRGGSLNHVGLRLADARNLEELRQQIAARGLRTDVAENVECCYARQDKFWLHSPDGVLWEFYTLTEDLDHHGSGQSAESIGIGGSTEAAQRSAEPPHRNRVHRIDQGANVKFADEDRTVDEVELPGTFNLPIDVSTVLQESLRVLKPGGVLKLHLLTADRTIADDEVRLPGPASVVRRVPIDREVITSLEESGFVDIRFDQLAERPCFQIGTAECRQTRISARAPAVRAAMELTRLMPIGPFREIHDDRGNCFRRGVGAAVDGDYAEKLSAEFPALFTSLSASPAESCGTQSRRPAIDSTHDSLPSG